MKNKLFTIVTALMFIILLAFSTIVKSQPQSKSGNSFYEVYEVDSVPIFAGGKPAMDEFVNKTIQKFNSDDCLGVVLVSFIVEKDGSVSDIQLIRKVCDPADNGVLDMVAKMPVWTPGYYTGVPVRVRIFLPVRFAKNNEQPQFEQK